jgi:hypothetical protein
VERGGGVYNAAHINKIQNALGVKIPRWMHEYNDYNK